MRKRKEHGTPHFGQMYGEFRGFEYGYVSQALWLSADTPYARMYYFAI